MKDAFEFITAVSIWIYSGVLLYAAIGFIKTRGFKSKPEHKNFTKATIIICARNEETNIERCLTSILSQNFDNNLLELILVNDASDDRTLFIAENILKASKIKYQIISNEEKSGKKKSITKAINLCQGNLIITRDADTYTQSNDWMKTIVDFHEVSKKEFIIAPINFQNKNNLLAQLQYFENAALTVISGGFSFFGKAFLCSGANLAFTKNIFNKVKGYTGHENIASGDDVLFLEDVKMAAPHSVAYLKQNDAVVYTYPLSNMRELIFQKIRWASKTSKNPNKLNVFMGFLVLFTHFWSILLIFLTFIIGHIPSIAIIFIFSRFLIDFLLLFLASRYYRGSVNWLWFLPSALVYSIYTIVTGFLSLFIKPNWK